MKEKVLHKDLSYKITGLLFQVHNDLGRYRNELQYCDYFEQLLIKNNILYKRENRLAKSFEGERAGRNICDFIIKKNFSRIQGQNISSKRGLFSSEKISVKFKIGIGNTG